MPMQAWTGRALQFFRPKLAGTDEVKLEVYRRQPTRETISATVVHLEIPADWNDWCYIW